MTAFVDFFKNSENVAKRMKHGVLSLDHIIHQVLTLESVKTFFKDINVDHETLYNDIDEWLQNAIIPEYQDAGSFEPFTMPCTPILGRVYFELSKKSIVEQLKNTPSGVDSLFVLMVCLSFPETSLCNALELQGLRIDRISQQLQEYVKNKHNIKNMVFFMHDKESDFDGENEVSEDEVSQEETKTGIRKALSNFCDDLTEMAEQGKFTNIIGREAEMFDISQVLSRKNKKNAILLGEAGVGKTQIVEGFANKIIQGEVPDSLKGFRIMSLNMTAMTAGTKFRGELEERVHALIKELERHDNIILFIDEMHTIMNAGGGSGNIDFGTMFKPALSRGLIRVIGATTLDEYRSHIEKDPAITRRFTKVMVNEPSYAEAEKILKGVVKNYEKYHSLKVEKDAINAIMEYSAKYLQNRRFPDKAIDILDAAMARRKVTINASDVVTREDIGFEISRVANIPLEVVMCSETERMRDLRENLKKRVFGQDEAIDVLVKNVLVARAGLRESASVQGAFLFVGPSGTGKTEITKSLSQAMGVEMIRFDMSEFAQEHTISKMIGSPPGYVGHDAGNGLLLDKIEQFPNCVLLLDEIEKAHPKVLLTFLQVLDEGRMTGSKGKTVYFNNVTVIMTTNLGARDAGVMSTGFGNTNGDGIDQAVKKFLPPEFINRIDAIVKFSELTQEAIKNIVQKYINDLNTPLKNRKVQVKFDKKAKDWLAEKGVVRGMGARPLKRLITQYIRVPLAEEMLYGALVNGGVANVTVVDGEVKLSYNEVRKKVSKVLESQEA